MMTVTVAAVWSCWLTVDDGYEGDYCDWMMITKMIDVVKKTVN